MQQSQVVWPQSHWGAPVTGNSQAQGHPPRQAYGPPAGPPANYGQPPCSAPPYRGPNQVNSGSGGPLTPPPPLLPGLSSGMVLAGPYAPPSSMQHPQSYGHPMGSYPVSRWQPPAPGATPAPQPQPGTGRATSDGPHLGASRLAMHPPQDPPPPGVSQSGTPAVTAAPIQPFPYQQFSSDPGSFPQPAGPPWMLPPQQGNQMQQRPSFSGYRINFQPTYSGHPHPMQDMAGTGPPGGQYGPARDPSLSKGVANPQASSLGNQPPSFPLPIKDASLESNWTPTVAETAQPKPTSPGFGDDQGSNKVPGGPSKAEDAEVPDALTAHKTADGAVHYYNSIKGQSAYLVDGDTETAAGDASCSLGGAGGEADVNEESLSRVQKEVLELAEKVAEYREKGPVAFAHLLEKSLAQMRSSLPSMDTRVNDKPINAATEIDDEVASSEKQLLAQRTKVMESLAPAHESLQVALRDRLASARESLPAILRDINSCKERLDKAVTSRREIPNDGFLLHLSPGK